MEERRRGSFGTLEGMEASVTSELDDDLVITEKELSECDREKLHLLGNIQDGAGHVLFFSHPQGEVLAADLKVHKVPFIRITKDTASDEDQCQPPPSKKKKKMQPGEKSDESDEEGQLKDAGSLLGVNIGECLPSKLKEDIIEAIEAMEKARAKRTYRFFSFEGTSYAISLSSATEDSNKIICVEIEEVEDSDATGNFYNTLISLGRVMEFYADEKILHTACDTVFRLLDQYDRGMVYQFNDDLSGEVVHEIKKEGVDSSYLGMRFPAADIPLPARKLFIKNGLRYIQNANADYNPIVDKGNTEIDLTHCRMRAVAKPHIVYLRNMGVHASVSIAIVVDNELWGLLVSRRQAMEFDYAYFHWKT